MNQLFPGAGRGTTEETPVLIRLASRTDLPQRARSLLTAALELARKSLRETLHGALTEFEKHLFKLSENARSGTQQQNYMQTTQELIARRALVETVFFENIEDWFARVDRATRNDKPAPSRAARESLSLVAHNDLDESLAVQEFAVRNEVRHSQALYELGHRFAVLVAMPALDGQTVPLGPACIGAALRRASEVLKIPSDHRVLLYRIFDRLASKDLTATYEAVNNYFIEQRILRHLRAQVVRVKKPGGAAHSAGDAGAEPAPETTAKETPAPAATAGTARATEGERPARAQAYASDERDVELFSTLRELLAGSRVAQGATATQPLPPNAFEASGEDVQGVLGALQNRPGSIFQPGGRELRSVTHLKQELLQQLRELSPGQTPQLRGEDSDTIDLVGMLFDNMSSSLRPDAQTKRLLPRLQVPLLRIALQDKTFFTRKSHPARQLLNSIAETGERWMDGTDAAADQDLYGKLQLLLDRLGSEFDGDVTVIEDLLGDLSQHVHTLSRKAEVSERRQVDAAIGREKLALARETAAQAVSDRIAAKSPNMFVRTVLEQAWADVLALTLLRQGESSDAYRKRIEVADRLIASSATPAPKGGAAEPQNEELREEIETGLSQIGYHQEDIRAVVDRLLVPDSAANDDAPISKTELASKLASKPRLGDDPGHAKPMETAAKRRQALQLNAAEQHMLKDLTELPFGTWFEFIINQQGDRVAKKLAWYSKLTGHCMFVNQRGARVAETTLEELARDMVRGQVFLQQPTQETFVDRAWGAIMSSLKRLGSIAGAFAPPPAEAL